LALSRCGKAYQLCSAILKDIIICCWQASSTLLKNGEGWLGKPFGSCARRSTCFINFDDVVCISDFTLLHKFCREQGSSDLNETTTFVLFLFSVTLTCVNFFLRTVLRKKMDL